ncbi:MAG: TatD family hydrolase [Flavobacterium sp.]|nr:TatD family hydrolase [Flavobacterium sp.]
MNFIDLHTHTLPKREDVDAVLNQYPAEADSTLAMFSTGIHPWYIAAESLDDELGKMEELLARENCVAVGECGLDKKSKTDFRLQLEAFEAQLKLATNFRMPVIVHCVAAFQEIISLKSNLSVEVPMIIHGFSKSDELAQQLLNHGFYLSFGDRILESDALRQVLKNVPADRFFLESDSADVDIAEIYKTGAESRGAGTSELIQQMHSNFNSVFNKSI